MSAGQIVDIAKQANAEQLGAAKASAQFASELENSDKVHVILTPEQKSLLQRELAYVPVYENTKKVSHDHPVLYALRELARANMTDLLTKTTTIPTLFIGCAGYELGNATLLNSPAFHFSLHNAPEAKDFSRIVPVMLVNLRRKLKSKLSETDRNILAGRINAEPSRAIQRFKDIQNLIDGFGTGDFSKTPRVSVGISGKYTRVVSYDSFYNLFEYDYLNLCSQTGFVEMYCVGILPFELLFENMPENDLYRYRTFTPSFTQMSALNYRGGYCDGYVHPTEAWKTLLTKKILRNPLFPFILNVEIVSSYGPMRIVKLSRANHSGHVFRSIELPSHLRFVRVLDLVASHKKNQNMKELVYFSVYEREYWSLVDYLLNIDPKSVTVPNACAYIRRNRAGVSMAGKDYMPAWSLREDEVMPLAVTGVAFATGTIMDAKDVLDATRMGSEAEVNWKTFLKTAAMTLGVVLSLGLAIPVSKLVKWLMSSDLFEKLVLTPSMEVVSYKNLSLYPRSLVTDDPYYAMHLEELAEAEADNHDMGPEFDDDGNVTWLGSHPDCTQCRHYRATRDPSDKQLIICDYKPQSNIDIELSEEDAAEFKNTLINACSHKDTPEILRKTLEEAYNNIPKGKIQWKGRLENVKAGPGCGKSALLRKFYDDQTLVYGPFGKLRSDYMNQTRADGSKFDMTFKTTHKGMKSYGKQIIAVDEWTAMDFRPLIVSAANNGAKTIILHGDERQTKIQPQEGVYIGRKVDFSQVSSHELVVNFRNPMWTVAVLNKDHGYNMFCNSDLVGKPILHELKEAAGVTAYPVMTFANLSAEYLASQEANSVRSNQGGTHENVGLIISDRDRNLVMNDELFRVAVSRHKKELHIFVEQGTEMHRLIVERLHLEDEEFQRSVTRLAKIDLKPLLRFTKSEATDVAELEKMGIFVFSDPEPVKEEFKYELPDPTEEDPTTGINWCSAAVVNELLGHENSQAYKLWCVKNGYVKYPLVAMEALIIWLRRNRLAPKVIANGKVVHKEKFLTHFMKEVLLVVETIDTEMDHVRLATDVEVFTSALRKWKFRIAGTNIVKKFKAIYGDDLTSKYLDAFPGELAVRYSLPDPTPEFLSKVMHQCVEHFKKRSTTPVIVLEPVVETPVARAYVGRWKDENSLVSVEHAPSDIVISSLMYSRLNRATEDFAPRDTLPLRQMPAERPLQPARDAWFLADTLSPIFSLGYQVDFMNMKYAAQGFANVPSNGTLAANWTLPVNSRGHPVREMDKTYKGEALSVGEGLKYFGNSNLQALQAVAHRYVRKRKVFRFNEQAANFAKSLSRGFQARNMTPVKIDLHKEADIIREWEFVAKQRMYSKRAEGETEQQRNVIRFHLKDIFKPLKDIAVPSSEVFNKVVNLAKCGQGISAWSSQANIEFGAATRIINHRFLASLRDHVTYNNKFTEDEIDEQLRLKKRILLPGAKTAVTDGADFDSMQNRFTQEIEREHSRYLGVPESFLDAYYEIRNDYKMTQTGLFNVKCRSEKTSGEPGTLLYNSQLGGTVTDNAVKGIGPMTLDLQGDDAKKTQNCLTVDESVLSGMRLYSEFKLKCEIGTNQEFCGNIEINGTLVPSVHRLFKKICAHTEKSESTFYEYKMAVMDKIKRIEKVGAETVIAASANAIGAGYREMEYVYDVVKSYSHLSYEQFRQRSIPVHAPSGWFF